MKRLNWFMGLVCVWSVSVIGGCSANGREIRTPPPDDAEADVALPSDRAEGSDALVSDVFDGGAVDDARSPLDGPADVDVQVAPDGAAFDSTAPMDVFVSPDVTVSPDRPPALDVPVTMDGPAEVDVPPDTFVPADRPTPTDTSVTTDLPADIPDAGTPCATLTAVNIARTGAATSVTGDTTTAWMEQTAGLPRGVSPIRPPSGSSTCVPMSGQVVFRYVVGLAPAALRVSTTNAGTPRNMDTVLYVTTRCASTLTAAACNDDDPEYATRPDRRVSSLVTTEVLAPGTAVFIVVGGFYPPGDGSTTVDHGPFELTINELPAVTDGGACDANGLLNRCNTDLVCVSDTLGGDAGHCRARGSAPGALCRLSEPRCDAGLTCSSTASSGVCVATAAPDGACSPRAVCPDGYLCWTTTLGGSVGECRRNGSVLRSACRPAGAVGGRCDAPLVCASDLDFARAPECVRAAVAGMACDTLRSICPTGTTCVTPNGNTTIGTCVADGTGPRARCRASGTRCDMGLECITVGAGFPTEELCLRRSTTNMPCGPALQCPDANTCYLTDLTDRVNGTCGAPGMSGGACDFTMPYCSGALVCSSTTGNGLCGTVSTAMGAACDRLHTRCGPGLSCVLSAGSQSMGTCQPAGSVAGADCRTGDTPCATGLTCNGSALSGGVCQRAVTAGMVCDPINGFTACPAMQYCLASAFNAGTCSGATRAEAEPNDTPASVMARAITAPTLITGALGRLDVDCVAVAVPAMGRIVAMVSDGNGRCRVNLGGRLAMDVYSPDGTTVRGMATQNGPFGSGSCAHVDGARAIQSYAGGLAAGTYYVCIRGVNDAAVSPPVVTDALASYVLSVSPLP